MKIEIDTELGTLVYNDGGSSTALPLYSDAAFEILSAQWLKVGWNQKYPYAFSWLGRPVIQLPEDLVRVQEVIYRLKPDVILETGVAHGGSLIFYASLCKAMGHGRVVGVDIEIRPHNRSAIESHELADLITLIEGSSIDSSVIAQVRSKIGEGQTVLVLLDSNHSKKHVLAELDAYHDLVSPNSYIVATDGSMRDLHDVPRGNAQWVWDHPVAAAEQFAADHPNFAIEQPPWPFNESSLKSNITHWPRAWLRRIRP